MNPRSALDWLLQEGWEVTRGGLRDPETGTLHLLDDAIRLQEGRVASRPMPNLDLDARNRAVAKIEQARGRAERPETPTLPAVPCATCPYRRDVPVGVWHATNFERLLRADRDPLGGATFGCHVNDGRWVACGQCSTTKGTAMSCPSVSSSPSSTVYHVE